MAELTQAERFAQAAVAQQGAARMSWKKRLVRLAVLLAGFYAAVCLAVYIFQKKIVYNPTVAADLAVKSFGFAEQQAQDISTTTSDNVLLRGWRILGNSNRGKLANSRCVILYFTGKSGNRAQHDGKFQRLAALGCDVVCFDYRGYGDSAGSPDEEGLGRDARAAWDFLQREGVKPGSTLLYGESLGSAVATRLACELSQDHTPPGGMILEGSFPRLIDPAQHLFFWLPVSLILNQHFPSVERIPLIECPLLVLHGTYDTIVPIGLGRALFAAAPPNARGIEKTFVECPNSGHVNLDTADAMLFEKSMRDFMRAALSLKADHAPEKREKHKLDFKHAVKPKQQ